MEYLRSLSLKRILKVDNLFFKVDKQRLQVKNICSESKTTRIKRCLGLDSSYVIRRQLYVCTRFMLTIREFVPYWSEGSSNTEGE
ncbi:unnamed protein product [Allacma fusca]|uniref:Uncharacterized protein n=1 Tax=Allacma fusca TaxID=39272 RepID=A0A8J2PGH2_9HEXA|nr:unnamed protein product [Allacma fusca]